MITIKPYSHYYMLGVSASHRPRACLVVSASKVAFMSCLVVSASKVAFMSRFRMTIEWRSGMERLVRLGV